MSRLPKTTIARNLECSRKTVHRVLRLATTTGSIVKTPIFNGERRLLAPQAHIRVRRVSLSSVHQPEHANQTKECLPLYYPPVAGLRPQRKWMSVSPNDPPSLPPAFSLLLCPLFFSANYHRVQTQGMAPGLEKIRGKLFRCLRCVGRQAVG